MALRYGALLITMLGPSACVRAGYAEQRDAAPVVDATVDAADLSGCTPGAAHCDADTLVLCTSERTESRRSCALGCDATLSVARCKLPDSSNGVDASWAEAAVVSWEPTADATVDTDAGTVEGLPDVDVRIVEQAGAPALAVFVFDTLTIPANVTIAVNGRRGVALLARSISIAGTLDLTGGRGDSASAPGPGGHAGSSSAAAGEGPGGGETGRPSASVQDGGGGGGGHAGAGGKGGQSLGGAGGSVHGQATLVPLVGGSGGGAGAPGEGTIFGAGGGGGGALQLVALERIDIAGVIHAGGGGGAAGNPVAADGGSGGGGGAGGAILIEAPSVTLEASGVLATNGGGGGGCPKFVDAGTAGTTGLASTQAAAGGIGAKDEGSGGAGSTAAGAGSAGQDGANNGGGGGGGAGRVRVNALVWNKLGVVSAAFSPGSLGVR